MEMLMSPNEIDVDASPEDGKRFTVPLELNEPPLANPGRNGLLA
jgi:hypothetical protein